MKAVSHPASARAMKEAHTVSRAQRNCRQVFILFQGQAGRMMIDPMQFLREARITDRNLIMIADRSRQFYQRGVSPEVTDVPSIIEWLRTCLAKMPHATDIMCVGSSSGAYAAVLCGYLLKVREVWAFAPPTDLTTVTEDQELDPAVIDSRYSDLQQLLRVSNGVTKYNIYYNESCAYDREAALRLKDCEGVLLHSEGGSGHGVILHMAKLGALAGLMPPFAGIG
jgi:hypothetical protein